MSFARVQNIVENCYDGGFQWESTYYKTPATASVQGVWGDLSIAPGNPRANFYTGTELTSTLFNSSRGIWTGGDVSPKTKHLHKVLICGTAAAPATFYLLDYLLFYPLIDMDSTDEQVFTNSVSLPRYSDGYGVEAFLVATNPYLGGAYFSMSYTNVSGVAGCQAQYQMSNTSVNIGTIVNSGLAAGQSGPFIKRVSGCVGIRSVQSLTFYGPNGGLAALVLAKPLAVIATNETTAAAEWDFIRMKPTLPRIYDGAYLNFICCPNATWASQRISGLISVVWN